MRGWCVRRYFSRRRAQITFSPARRSPLPTPHPPPDPQAELRAESRARALAALAAAPPGGGAAAPPPPEPPSPAEEALLLRHYAGCARTAAVELRLPPRVAFAACAYLARLFLRASPLELDPQAAAVGCLYLAGKAGEAYVSAAELGRLAGVPVEALLRLEMHVLAGVGLDLVVHGPHAGARALLADAPELAGAAAGAAERARGGAAAAADALALTDAPLLWTPGQLALAAARAGLRRAGVPAGALVARAAAAALDARGGAAAGQLEAATAALEAALAEIDAMGAAGAAAVPQEAVAAADRKLKLCRAALAGAGEGDPARAAARAAKAARKAERAAEARASAEAAAGVVGDARKRGRAEGGG